VGRLQLGARVEAQVVGENLAGGLEDLERLGLFAGRGQDQHEPGLQRLVERMAGGGLPHNRQHPVGGRRAGLHRQVGGRLHRRGVFAVDRDEGGMRADLVGDARRDRPAPQVEGVQQGLGGRLPAQGAEPSEVHGLRRDVEPVAAGAAHQKAGGTSRLEIRFEEPAQHTDVPLDLVERRVGRLVTPQHGDDLVR